MSLKITNSVEDKVAVLKIAGEVDMFSSPQARNAIMELVKQRVPRVVVELSGVSYMDSSGVATLIEGLQLCQKYNGTLVVAGLRDNVREVFELTRLDKIFQIYKDVDTAKVNE
ncbi:anti-sigma factor antagonist [candidate division KSB1 bacterium]|nr:STAS domain-containing protein [candidate division KSB1 bacterium]RQW01297.1 MAG: anti-sigma factor antagonist [candidate division KSB1 bacterium]